MINNARAESDARSARASDASQANVDGEFERRQSGSEGGYEEEYDMLEADSSSGLAGTPLK